MTSITPTIPRHLARVITLPAPGPGFGGEGHEAILAIDAKDFAQQDPFIFLADDRLDLAPGAPVGGAHPHAGFEIATFLVRGALNEGDEGISGEGDILWTTAGRGIVHGEHAEPQGPTRILQLWFALPERDRWTEPHFEVTRAAEVPVHRAPGVTARVYSGRSGDAANEWRRQVPITLVDIRLDAGARFEQVLPGRFNGFLYPIDGRVRADGTELVPGQIAWLDRPEVDDDTSLPLEGGAAGTRVLLYAGEPQRFPVVTHGPFVGSTRADLLRIGREYSEGRFVRMSDLVRAAR